MRALLLFVVLTAGAALRATSLLPPALRRDMAARSRPTPLRHVRFGSYARLFVKDESVNDTGTFKDRLARAAVLRYRSADVIATISYGNTALSLGRALAEARGQGLTDARLVVFVPTGYDTWTLGPSSKGTAIESADLFRELRTMATVLEVDLGKSILDDFALRQLAAESGVSGNRFVNVTEGLDVPAYVGIIEEAVAELGRAPDVCVVPFGAGILCNEIRDYLSLDCNNCQVVPISVPRPNSVARMLYGPIWVDCEQLARDGVAMSRHCTPDRTGAARSPYPVHAVSEEEIMMGIDLAAKAQISAEPSGAVGFGVLRRLPSLVPGLDARRDTVLLINTGNAIDAWLGQR